MNRRSVAKEADAELVDQLAKIALPVLIMPALVEPVHSGALAVDRATPLDASGEHEEGLIMARLQPWPDGGT